jgi:hypothetical protein
MNSDNRATEAAYRSRHGLDPAHTFFKKPIPADFPIEHARLRHLG